MEADILEVLLRQRQRIACVGQEYIATMFIDSHIGVLAAFEVGKLLLIVALDPACLVDRDWLPTALCAILMLQAVLDYLELQLTYRTDNLATIQARSKELSYTLIHQLINALCQLLELHRVGILDIAEKLRRE